MPSKANVGATHKEQRQCTLYKRLRKVWPVEAAHAPICRMSVSFSASSPLFCFTFRISSFRVFSSVLSISLSESSLLFCLFHFQSSPLFCLSHFQSLLLCSVCLAFRVFSSILSHFQSSPLFCLSRFQSLLLYQQLWWLPWLFSVDISKSLTISFQIQSIIMTSVNESYCPLVR